MAVVELLNETELKLRQTCNWNELQRLSELHLTLVTDFLKDFLKTNHRSLE